MTTALVQSLNPLSAKFIKWSNTPKQFVGKLPTNCLSVFDHFSGLALKGLNKMHMNYVLHNKFRMIIFHDQKNIFKSSPFADVFQNRCSQNFCNIHRKRPVLELLSNKVAGRAYSRPILRSTIERCPFCKNYAKLYFDAKHLEKGLNWRVNILGSFFHIKVSFMANIEGCPKFIEYALAGLEACNFIKERIQRRRFLVNIAKFLRTPILKNVRERLLLYF